jgi:hypothetical protein
MKNERQSDLVNSNHDGHVLGVVGTIINYIIIGATIFILGGCYGEYMEPAKPDKKIICKDEGVKYITEIATVLNLYTNAIGILTDNSLSRFTAANQTLEKIQQAEDILEVIDSSEILGMISVADTLFLELDASSAFYHLRESAELQQEGRDGRQKILESMQRYKSANVTLQNLVDKY